MPQASQTVLWNKGFRQFKTGDNRKYYDAVNMGTSDDELQRKIVIRNFKNAKDESPNIIDIDTESGEVRQVSTDHDRLSYKNLKNEARTKMITTFLPNGFPETVHP